MPSARSRSADTNSNTISIESSPSHSPTRSNSRGRSRSRCSTCGGSRSPSPRRFRSPISKYGRPLRLLSLDGGGVRGLSSVMMLKEIMKQVNADREVILEPYEIFDMIGGTSTGGLIAIMLGRLRMTITEVENTYMDMSTEIFWPRRSKWNVLGKLHDTLTAEAKFSDTKFKEAIIKKIVDKGFPSEELLQDSLGKTEGDPCKVFVCSVRGGNASPAILRSYKNPRGVDFDFDHLKIYEAAKATASAPTYFGSTMAAKFHQKLSDGGLAYNNPIRIVYREAQQIWPLETDFLLISLGTGAAPGPMVAGGAIKMAKAVVRLVTQTEREWEDFFYDHEFMMTRNRLFRFNVSQGLAQVPLEDFNGKAKIADATQAYLTEPGTRQNLENCVQVLRNTTQKKLWKKDHEIAAELCSYCHKGIKFTTHYTFCGKCLTIFCKDCSNKGYHPEDHQSLLYDACSWRWAGTQDDHRPSDTARCIRCGRADIRCRIECRPLHCNMALCQDCFNSRKSTRKILTGHLEKHKFHHELGFIRPQSWKVVSQGQYGICACQTGKSCVDHCGRCGTAIFLGDTIYQCKISEEVFAMSQCLCQKCKDSDGSPPTTHFFKSITYRFHETTNMFDEFNEFLTCHQCSEKLPISKGMSQVLMSHEHVDFDLHIGPRFMETWRNGAFQDCPNRGDVDDYLPANARSAPRDGPKTPYSCRLCERDIIFDTVTAKCTECEAKYCTCCYRGDMIHHIHSSQLTTCEYKQQHPDKNILHHVTCSACKRSYRKSMFEGLQCASCNKFFLCFDPTCLRMNLVKIEHQHNGRPAPLICTLVSSKAIKQTQKDRGGKEVAKPTGTMPI